MSKIINYKKTRNNVDVFRGGKTVASRLVFRLLVALFLATVIYALFFAHFLDITEIKISGLEKLEEASIRSVIEEKNSGKYLRFIEKNNLILLRENSLKKALMDNFKLIEGAQVEKVFPGILKVEIKERKLTMIFCSGEACYILNEKGEPYPVENFSAEELEKENLITLRDSSGTKIEADNNPLEDDFQEFILQLGGKVLEDTGIVLKKNYETPSRMSGDLKVETEEGFQIYFSSSVGLEKEILMLKAVLDEKIEKGHQKDLEYIDLRIDNKVFYKFRDGAVQEENQKTETSPVEDEKKKENKKKKK